MNMSKELGRTKSTEGCKISRVRCKKARKGKKVLRGLRESTEADKGGRKAKGGKAVFGK